MQCADGKSRFHRGPRVASYEVLTKTILTESHKTLQNTLSTQRADQKLKLRFKVTSITLTSSLKEAKELLWLFLSGFLLRIGSLDSLHVVNVGGFVVSAELRSSSGNGLRGSLFAPRSSPVKSFSVSKDGNALFLLESAAGIFLVGLQPSLLLGSLDVTVVP